MKYLFTLLLLNFLFAPVYAQTEVVPVVKSLAPTVEENALLWRISGNNLPSDSYLYGTIHLIDKKDFFLSDSAQAYIDRSDLVTFEINMNDMTNLGAQLGLLMQAMMDDGQTLRDLLNDEDYKVVKDHFDEMGLPLFMFERMKPMFLTVLASGDMSPNSLNSGEMVSYELEIMELAKTREKELGGLETIEFQMSVFDSIPYDVQAQMLVESIKSADAGEEEFAKMVELYKAQNIIGMVEMMGEEEGIGEYEDILLVRRNKNWIPIMGEMMTAQPTFFAVGAGHLAGEAGVISLLRQAGYTVEPVW